MSNHLGSYFRRQRTAQGLTVEVLAFLIGYRNARKGRHRIASFEAGQGINDVLLVNIAEILGIDLPMIEELMEKDQRESSSIEHCRE